MNPNQTSHISEGTVVTEEAVAEERARIETMREAAKHLASLTSLLPAIYFAAISFSDLHAMVHGPETLPFVLPAIPWLISLALVGHILLPHKAQAEDLNTRFTRIKRLVEAYRIQLWCAYAGLLGGLIWAMIEIAYYLWAVPAPAT